MFRDAAIPCAVTDNLEQAHWEKLTWNIPFNGLGVASAAGFDALNDSRSELGNQKQALSMQPCLTTDKLLADARWARLVRELILEIIGAARATGLGLRDSLVEEQIERTRTMGAYKASTILDFERGQPLELNALFLEPLRQAKKAGVSVPRLERLCQVLCQLDASRLM